MGSGFIALIVMAVVALIVAGLAYERYRPRTVPQRPMPTTEVFIDPVTHRRMRVWMDPATGAREYREELETTATTLPPPPGPGLLPPPPPPQERF
jgi:hypothetical protein